MFTKDRWFCYDNCHAIFPRYIGIDMAEAKSHMMPDGKTVCNYRLRRAVMVSDSELEVIDGPYEGRPKESK